MKPSDLIRQYRVELRELINRNDVTNPRFIASTDRYEDTEGSDLNILVDPTDTTTLFTLGKLQSEIKNCFQIQTRLVTPNSIPESDREELIHASVVL
jgi:uncharacterized protein